MIVLSASTFTLQLVLSAGTADVDVSYVDRTATAYPIGATEQTAATAMTQTICSAPAASTSREIDFLSVKIKTTGGVVTVQKLNSSGSVTTQLISVTLLDEEVLVYTHGSGWCALDANGNRKEATSSNFGAITVTNLTDSALTSGRVVLAGTGGLLQDSASITHSAGNLGLAAGLTLSGTASNITLGSNYISNDGTDAGLSFGVGNDATFSAGLTVSNGLSVVKATGNSASFTDSTTYTYAISPSGFGGTPGTLTLPILVSGTEVARFTTAGINGVLGGTTPAAASVTTLAASGFITTQGGSGSNFAAGVTGGTGSGVFSGYDSSIGWIRSESSGVSWRGLKIGAQSLEIYTASGASTLVATFGADQSTTLTGTLGVSGITSLSGGTGIGTRLEVGSAAGASASFAAPTTSDNAAFMWNKGTSGDNAFVSFGTEASYTERGSITYNRGGGLVAYNTTSDYRSKDVFGAWEGASTMLSALTVHNGRMKGATLRRPMLIAHEAQAIVPWAVTGTKDAVDKDGKPVMQQISEGALTPLLIAGWQDHESRLAELEAFRDKAIPALAKAGITL